MSISITSDQVGAFKPTHLSDKLNSKCEQGCDSHLSKYIAGLHQIWSICVATEEAPQFEQASESDQQIRQLLQLICCNPNPTDLVRQKALNRFLILVQRLPGLYRSSHQDYSQALNLTWEWLSRNIHKLEPYLDQPPTLVRQWLVARINGYLKWRIRDLYAPDDPNLISLDRPIDDGEGGQTTLKDLLPNPSCKPLRLDLLERRIAQLQEMQRQRFGQRVWQWIEQDPDQQLTQCHLRNRPNCNCHILAEQILLHHPPQRIADLARTLNVNNQTLYSHWNRQCLPLLKEIARRFEPLP
jgi:hypothetical protein